MNMELFTESNINLSLHILNVSYIFGCELDFIQRSFFLFYSSFTLFQNDLANDCMSKIRKQYLNSVG